MRITKLMKIIEFHMRNIKINKNTRNPQENHETNESPKNQRIITKLMKIIEFHMRNIENHLNLIIQQENHENHENHKSPCEIIEKHKK